MALLSVAVRVKEKNPSVIIVLEALCWKIRTGCPEKLLFADDTWYWLKSHLRI